MRRALDLAARGKGLTSPNPMVGCVIVRGGCVIGEGFLERAGGPHAEVNAIRVAGGDVADATLYVTLEPCCHHGKTPPCTDLIIQLETGACCYRHTRSNRLSPETVLKLWLPRHRRRVSVLGRAQTLNEGIHGVHYAQAAVRDREVRHVARRQDRDGHGRFAGVTRRGVAGTRPRTAQQVDASSSAAAR